MNGVFESSSVRRGADAVGTVIGALVWGLLRGVGVVLGLVLGILEPLVRNVLSYLSFATLLIAGLFYVAGSPGRHVSYDILLGFALGCMLILAVYEALLRWLER